MKNIDIKSIFFASAICLIMGLGGCESTGGSQGSWTCTKCGKTHGNIDVMMRHMRDVHGVPLSLPR